MNETIKKKKTGRISETEGMAGTLSQKCAGCCIWILLLLLLAVLKKKKVQKVDWDHVSELRSFDVYQ